MKRFFILTCLIALCIISASAEISQKPRVQVVFVLDTTGSMSELIQAAKDKIWAIAGTLATAKPSPDISLGLVGYRDRGDAYITRSTILTTDIDRVYADLMSYSANGGGDGEESVNQALYEAVHNFAWDEKPDTYKVMFLVGDWPPHMDYDDDVKYQATCRDAKVKGIIINTIQMGDLGLTVPVWNEIAASTGGQYFKIGIANVHVHYDTPYDKEIGELSMKYDSTRVYYGDTDVMMKNEAREKTGATLHAASPDSVVAQRMYYNMSEAGRSNFLGENELVDKVARGEIKLDEVKSEELPEEMRTMSSQERERFIADRINERKSYEQRLSELNSQRQEFIKTIAKENTSKEESSFENQVYKSLQTQGAEKNINLADGLVY